MSLNPSPIFIGGYFKSGTSLLRALLGQHPAIASGLETHWFALDPASGTGRGGEPIAHAAARIATFFRLDTGVVETAIVSAPSGEAAVDAVLTMHARQAGKRRWAEKTPDNLRHVTRIFAHWPEARFVHILRDPRDVYVSLRNCGKAGDPDAFARSWSDWIASGESEGTKAGPERFISIRYEDLVSSPEAVMRRVIAFVGEPWDPGVAQFAGKSDEYDLVLQTTGKRSTTLESLSRPLFGDRAGLWRRELSDDEAARLEAALLRAGGWDRWQRAGVELCVPAVAAAE